MFTNLHMVLDYYMNANGVFLIMAMGFAFVALLALAAFAAVTGHRAMHLPH